MVLRGPSPGGRSPINRGKPQSPRGVDTVDGALFAPQNIFQIFSPAQNNFRFSPAQNIFQIFSLAQNNFRFSPAQNNFRFSPAQNNSRFFLLHKIISDFLQHNIYSRCFLLRKIKSRLFYPAKIFSRIVFFLDFRFVYSNSCPFQIKPKYNEWKHDASIHESFR